MEMETKTKMEYRIGVKDVIIFIFLLGLFAAPVLAGIDTVTDRINVNFLRLYSGSNFNVTDTSGNLLLLFDGASWVLYDNGAVTANFSYSNTTLNATTLYLPNAITVQGAGWTINSAWTWGDYNQIFDTNTFCVNATNNRIGIRTCAPLFPFHVGAGDDSTGTIAKFERAGATEKDFYVGAVNANEVALGSSGDMDLYVGSTDTGFGTRLMRLDDAGTIILYNNAEPSANNTYDLGSAARRWRDIYTQGAVDVGEIREAYPFSVEPDVGDVVAVDTVNSTKDMLRKAINMSDIVRGVFAKHGYWANDTTYTYDENGTAINATNISIWIEPRVAKFGLFSAKVNGTVKKGDYLLCCTSPGVLGSIRTVSIRSQVLVVHPIYAWLYTNYPAVVASWTPEQIRVLSLGLPTVGIAMEDYNSDMIGMISVDLMPQ